MKKAVALLLGIFFLAGCSAETELSRALDFRSRLLAGQGCSFTAQVTADYGDELQEFTMDCEADTRGGIGFTVSSPETIAGISGTLSEAGGALTFDDTALQFPLMAQDSLSPVSAPWIFLRTLRSGYIVSACMEEDLLRLSIDDSFDEDALRLDIWLDENQNPIRAEILHDGLRILTLRIGNFRIV